MLGTPACCQSFRKINRYSSLRVSETSPSVAVHELRLTSVQKNAEIRHGPCQCRKQLDGGDHGSGLDMSGSAVPVSQGKSRLGAANRGTHSSRPHRQAAVGRYVNSQLGARLMLLSKSLRCRRTEARKIR
jgi:hypothetical protein